MNPQIRLNLKTLTDAAAAVGAALPDDVASVLTATPPLPESAVTLRASVVERIADAATLPAKAAEKAVREALDELARAEARDSIRARVDDALDERRWQAVTSHRADVLAAFAVVLADDLAALNEHAATAPISSSATNLAPDLYAAQYESRKAAARLEAALPAIRLLRPVPAIPRAEVAVTYRARLALVEVPEHLAEPERRAFRRALTGRADDVKGSPAEWYAVAARLGARFVLADRDTVRANAERLAYEPPADDSPTPRARLLA